MILLRPDCLVFKHRNGDNLPFAADQFALDIIGEAVGMLDQEILKNAAGAVLHFFKEELGRTTVTVGEFAGALESTLSKLGFDIKTDFSQKLKAPILDSNLREIASETGPGFEMMFFHRLRQELRLSLCQSPKLLRYQGLRPCVKHLLGAKRWSGRCQDLSDQIIRYIRTCMESEKIQPACALVVY
ncbi:MAG TPA: hypothetical protein VGE41_10170 [Verrucomicrobiae bacterium]|jgi:hypothetical protein